MKKSRVCWFAFRPEQYHEMEEYLNDMLAEGWRLRWCRGILAGFEPALEEEKNLRYVVDPEGATSLIYLRRYPKNRLNGLLRMGWYGVAKCKGCQILATVDPELVSPVPNQDQTPLIKNTCRLASLLWILLLIVAVMWISTKKAVVYSLVLTNIYLVLGLLAAFMLVYHAANAIILTVSKKEPDNPRICKRYLIHTGMLILLILVGTILEVGGRNDILLYMSIPIVIIALAIILLQVNTGTRRNINRLSLIVGAISLVMCVLVVVLNNRMSDANAEWTAKQQETLLAQVDQLPVLRLSDLGDQSEPQQAVQTNSSILGDNLLYAEESDAGYIFTNYTTMRSPALAKPIFNYLYQQAQVDFNETFEIDTSLGIELHVLKDTHSGLFQEGNTVCLFTVPEGTDVLAAAQILLEKDALVLP